MTALVMPLLRSDRRTITPPVTLTHTLFLSYETRLPHCSLSHTTTTTTTTTYLLLCSCKHSSKHAALQEVVAVVVVAAVVGCVFLNDSGLLLEVKNQ
eukprot:9311-Heterococcus_DN1.PRE.4